MFALNPQDLSFETAEVGLGSLGKVYPTKELGFQARP